MGSNWEQNVLQNNSEPEEGHTYVMYHGTSRQAAEQIKADGFHQSSDGMLGRGVYISRDAKKAMAYPRGLPANQCVVLKLRVNVGRVKRINYQGHPLQKTWHDHGYDTAWCPPRCGMVASGLEEDCVWDPDRVEVMDVLEARPAPGVAEAVVAVAVVAVAVGAVVGAFGAVVIGAVVGAVVGAGFGAVGVGAVGAGVGAVIGAVIGAVVGAVGTIVGAVVGAVGAVVFGAVVGVIWAVVGIVGAVVEAVGAVIGAVVEAVAAVIGAVVVTVGLGAVAVALHHVMYGTDIRH